MSNSGIGDGIVLSLLLGLAAMPLAIWKIIDILIWFFSHISWNWK